MLGDNIKKRRKHCSMSQAELSRLSGVPQTTISYAESNMHKPNIETLALLARALNNTIDELYYYKEPEKPITLEAYKKNLRKLERELEIERKRA